jgi:hypothetical protein
MGGALGVANSGNEWWKELGEGLFFSFLPGPSDGESASHQWKLKST